MKGSRAGDVNARSRTVNLEDPLSGKLVCTPGMFKRVNPCSAAVAKYGKEALSSEELCFLRGSADRWWMLKSPTTRVGKEERGRASVGATVLSVMVFPRPL